MKRRAVEVPPLCGLELSDDDVVKYTHVDDACLDLKPYRGISVCRQLYERLFGGREGYSYDGFLNQITSSQKMRDLRTVHTIRANEVKVDDDFPPEVHDPSVLWDPSRSWARVVYNIDDVSDKFNELADLKAVCAWPEAVCKQMYPIDLLPDSIRRNVQNLGYLDMDIQPDGTVQVVGSQIKMPKLERPMGVLHFTMSSVVDQRIHSNVLLFMQGKDGKYTVDRFESHGSDVGTKEQPNSLQVKCNFNWFYDSGSMDDIAAQIAKGYGAVYLKPMQDFPVLGQSISNQSGHFHKMKPIGAEQLGFRRKKAHVEMGDPFCAAHTAYYMVLRLANPELDRSVIYSYLHGPADLSEEQRGGRASDLICHFILWAHNKFHTMIHSPAFIASLEQLG
jgi:hypothetical protein